MFYTHNLILLNSSKPVTYRGRCTMQPLARTLIHTTLYTVSNYMINSDNKIICYNSLWKPFINGALLENGAKGYYLLICNIVHELLRWVQWSPGWHLRMMSDVQQLLEPGRETCYQVNLKLELPAMALTTCLSSALEDNFNNCILKRPKTEHSCSVKEKNRKCKLWYDD